MDEEKVQQNRRAQDEQATSRSASVLGIQYLDTRSIENTITLANGVMDVPTMRQNRMVPLVVGNNRGQAWQFGITTQTPQSFVRDLTKKYNDEGHTIGFFIISNSGYDTLMSRYDPTVKVEHSDIQISHEGDSETKKVVSETLETVGSDEIFDYLIDQADKLNASDIHIENQRTNIRVRMRIDGVLHPVADIEKDRSRMILAAIASKANLSTASKVAQSGNIQKEIKRGNKTHILNLRVEMIPTLYGQDSVLRLFNFDESMLNLDKLGLNDFERERINSIITHPRGMVLMVGPTGSGKSTTLYSIINALNTPGRKIITLEDPVEYGITGVSQIPINTNDGQSFAEGLKAVLRLDPDVVMVGEIRDADTAKTAIQASITGHLVLSSFHATSAAAAFSRMIDLIGVNPIFSSAIRLVIAQRLVRRLDNETKQEYEPDEATRNWVKYALKDLPAHVKKPDLNTFKLYKPVISEKSPFGFKGRVAIMEQLVVDENIQKFIRGDIKDANTENIERSARNAGMVTLLENGILAALRGETSLEELNQLI